jgi:signal transduction histidine kinase
MFCIVAFVALSFFFVSAQLPLAMHLPEPLCLLPMQGDPDRLRGILLNLYTNAAKFTRRGAIALRVSVAGPNYR